ncbi:hypothetical protein RB623_17640 [Mesorhizobium sp. LHD-90]|uniref:hypothetical protein n=1 Tax=Mesorhizobium sp. LHD-90 TaxID=3071414 RepID=UPI0027DF7CD7|nr:hypothetical protein [Mesorhizobium sp. LHD-90]MDQ6435882.1 hypothetical protein [Mesorhizobium sp. LHD-90]
MEYAIVRYGVKEERRAENRALVEKVFDDLHRTVPDGLRYLVLELEDGEFVHLVAAEGETSPLPKLAAFRAFTESHEERRSTPVARKSARIVGAYRMLADGKQE